MCRIFLFPLLLGLLFALALPVAAQGPELTVVSPTQGEEISSTTVTVTFETANINLVQTTVPVSEAGQHPEANRPGEGHIHLMLDLQPLVDRAQPGDRRRIGRHARSPISSFRPAGTTQPTSSPRSPLQPDGGLLNAECHDSPPFGG